MAPPVITSVETPTEPRADIRVEGTGFGFVESVAFIDPNDSTNNIFAKAFQIDSGTSIHVTVPDGIYTGPVDTPGNTYIVRLTTTENEVSSASPVDANQVVVNPITGVVPQPSPPVVPIPYPLPTPGVDSSLDQLRSMLRLELSDQARSFQTIVTGDGTAVTRYEMPVRHIDPNSVTAVLTPHDDPENPETLILVEDYSMDAFGGAIVLSTPLSDLDVLVLTGTRYRFFETPVLDQFLRTAFIQVTHGRSRTTATINAQGYRQYQEFGIDWDTLPEVEWLPTVVLAKTFALWVLVTDSSYNIDVQEDGAGIPRSQLYQHLRERIVEETQRFRSMATMLNIGLERIEMTTLRRVARLTGRLVPVYVEKEYDDFNLPIRVLPQIDHSSDEDTEFVDPFYLAGFGFGGGFGP